MSTAGKIINGIWYLCVALLILTLSNAAVTETPTILSYVTSDSMAPTLNINDYYFIVPKTISTPDVNDIVVFRSQHRGYFVHRIIDRVDQGFITKGDNSPFTDQQSGEPFVTNSQIIGRVLTFQNQPVTVPWLWKFTRHFKFLNTLIRKNWAVVGGGFLALSLLSFFVDQKRTPQKRERRKPLRAKHVTLPAMGLMLIVSTLFMYLAQERLTFQYWSTYLREGSQYQRPDTDFEMMVEIYNMGPVPHFILIDAPQAKMNTLQLARYVGPNSTLEIPLLYHAKDQPGFYENEVKVYRFLPLLPPHILHDLLEVHPFLPILVLDFILLIPIYILYRWINPNQIITLRLKRTGGVI